MTCTDGTYIDGRRIETGDCSGPHSARSVLLNPRIEAAVLETARGGILREGLGFEQCDVAVVTNVGGGDHLGLRGVRHPRGTGPGQEDGGGGRRSRRSGRAQRRRPAGRRDGRPLSRLGDLLRSGPRLARPGRPPRGGGRAAFVRAGVIVLDRRRTRGTAASAAAGAADAWGRHWLPGGERPGRGRRGVGAGPAPRRYPCGTGDLRRRCPPVTGTIQCLSRWRGRQ